MERTSILLQRRNCYANATSASCPLYSFSFCWLSLIERILARPSIHKKQYTTNKCKGNAKIQGMTKDLDMENQNAGRYNIALFIFFIPYILFEVPSNLILKKVAPSTWLSLIMVLWGMSVMTFLMRILTTYRHLNYRNGTGEHVWRSCCYACPFRLVRSRALPWYVVQRYRMTCTYLKV
jgi:hypothetical protein